MEQEFSNEEQLPEEAVPEQTAAEEVSVPPVAPKKARWDSTKIVLAVTAAVSVLALACLLIWLVATGTFGPGEGDVQDSSTEQLNYDPNNLPSYSGTDEEALAAKDNVVATVGDVQLTNAQLQVYYWSQVYNFIGNYSSYLSYFGVDFTKPLDSQVYNQETGQTWEQMFIDGALNTWGQMVAIQQMGEKDGFVLSDADLQRQDVLIQQLHDNAKQYNYDSLQAMVEKEMGKGATADAYIDYVKLDFYCGEYFNSLVEANKLSMDKLEAFYEENEESFTSAGYGKDAGKLVDIRHILIKPEGGKINEDGRTYTYTEAEWAAGEKAAQAVYDAWLAGEKTQDSFAQLAQKHSADGSAADGGLYENVSKGQMVEEFDSWIFDENRKSGDHGIVKTVYGYHIMYFVGGEEAWIRYGNNMYVNEIASNKLAEVTELLPLEEDLTKVVIGQVQLG